MILCRVDEFVGTNPDPLIPQYDSCHPLLFISICQMDIYRCFSVEQKFEDSQNLSHLEVAMVLILSFLTFFLTSDLITFEISSV